VTNEHIPGLVPTADLRTYETCSRREWLATNGIGGYASSTLAGSNTRRYHGLLVPAFSPPLGRAVLLAKLEESVRVQDSLYLLSANEYPSVVQPQGFRHLAKFAAYPVPTFTYVFHNDGVILEKRIWMPHGLNTVYVQYFLSAAPAPVRISLQPLMSYKDYHSEQHRWDGFHGTMDALGDGRWRFVAYDKASPVFFSSEPGLDFIDESGWYYNFEHSRERERGLDFTEDLYCPGRFSATLAINQTLTLIATVERDPPAKPHQAYADEVARQERLLRYADVVPGKDPTHEALVRASSQFVIEKSERVARATVIAGYHWFTDWGRDTMISLPGLCLSTGRYHVARDILEAFARSVKGGLLPNRFSDSGEGAEYNTVDASLWFFHAVSEYARLSGDWAFACDEMLPALRDIVGWHIAGTDYGIHVDSNDGLLVAGQPGVQLTWMDARVGDWVVTPRMGKPVEINALWYNALRVTAELMRRADLDPAPYDLRADEVKAAFGEAFWNPVLHCLYDVIAPDGRPDPSVRPNQIFAVSLPNALIEGDQAKRVVDKVAETLLTPFGLRTLAPGPPEYRGRYGPGDQAARDSSYHQGTVWPWLLGGFIDAHLKVYNDPATARAFLTPLLTQGLDQYGAGTLAEIFDGDPPHAPNGCIAQAWSVAEALRAYLATAVV
jgi:predicted glycogen debranching enzyme